MAKKDEKRVQKVASKKVLSEEEASKLKRCKNLRPPTAEEARERGRLGGIKSGEARRRRKTFREEMLAILDADDGRYNTNICTALIKKAEKGDLVAFTTIRDTIGEKPVDKFETNSNGDFEVNINIRKNE